MGKEYTIEAAIDVAAALPSDVFCGVMRSPVWYASMFGQSALYGWQMGALEKVWGKERVALRTCNESGKTSVVVACLGLAVMAEFPGAQVVSTSGSWRQIESQLWPVLRAKLSQYRSWRVTSDKIYAPAIRRDNITLQSTWEPFSTNDPGKAEGYHSRSYKTATGEDIYCPLCYIIDEAKTVAQEIFDAMERCNPDYVLVCSSPGEDFGAFYDCFDKYAALWNATVVDWTMCPHLVGDPRQKARIERYIRVRGESDPLVRSQIYGDWIRSAGYMVFDVGKIKHAMAGINPRYGHERRGAVDTSDGVDEQVFAAREGNTVLEMKTYNIKDMTILARVLVEDFRRWGLTGDQLVVDNGGAGKSLIDTLVSLGYPGIRRYMAEEAPRDKTIYANRFTEDCFETLSYRLDYINIPNDDVLESQMRKRKYVMRNGDSNKRRLEPKTETRKREGSSPDRLDTMIMLFSDMPPPENYPELRKKMGMAGELFETMKRGDTPGNDGWPAFGGMRLDM